MSDPIPNPEYDKAQLEILQPDFKGVNIGPEPSGIVPGDNARNGTNRAIRKARNTIKHYEERKAKVTTAEAARILKLRHERAVAFLVTLRFTKGDE